MSKDGDKKKKMGHATSLQGRESLKEKRSLAKMYNCGKHPLAWSNDQSHKAKFGNSKSSDFNLSLAGTGGSNLPDLKAEFSDIAHTRGVLSAARSADPNSANSQFFICFESAPHLDRQYSAFGKVIKGMEFIDKIKKGDPNSGAVSDPDIIISLRSK